MYKFVILGYVILYGKDLLNIGLITLSNKVYLTKLKILFPNTAKSIEKVHIHIYSIFDKSEIVKIENLILRDSKLIKLQKIQFLITPTSIFIKEFSFLMSAIDDTSRKIHAFKWQFGYSLF
jgi:hypothetical protein